MAEDAVIALRSAGALWLTPVQTRPEPGCRDQMEKMSDPFSSRHLSTQSLSEASQSCLLPSLFSTWSCKFLGAKGVSPPLLHPKQVPQSPATRRTWHDQCHPEEQPGFMNWSLSLLLLPVGSQAQHPETLQVVSLGPGEAVSERAVWAMQPLG